MRHLLRILLKESDIKFPLKYLYLVIRLLLLALLVQRGAEDMKIFTSFGCFVCYLL